MASVYLSHYFIRFHSRTGLPFSGEKNGTHRRLRQRKSMDNAPLYRALADETRRRLIKLLLEHNFCVSALARSLGVSESAVSQHIRILKETGLLSGERRGYHMHYAINRERLRALARDIEAMADITARDDANGLLRLPMAPLPRKEK